MCNYATVIIHGKSKHIKRDTMKNWFQLTASRMENVTYQKLSPAERLYLEYIISEYARRGAFYQSDLEIAVTLGMSVDKVRQARRKVGTEPESVRLLTARARGVECPGGYGWIVYKHGWKRGVHGLATQYLDVPIAERKKGTWYAEIPRFTFERLFSYVQAKRLTHADVVVWLVLAYKFWRCRGNVEDHPFFITKKELVRLSGVANAAASVQHLYEAVTFTGDAHLFLFSDLYQRLTFEKWTWYGEPDESKGNAEQQQKARQWVAAQVTQKKAAAKRKSTAQMKKKRLQRKSATT